MSRKKLVSEILKIAIGRIHGMEAIDTKLD